MYCRFSGWSQNELPFFYLNFISLGNPRRKHLTESLFSIDLEFLWKILNAYLSFLENDFLKNISLYYSACLSNTKFIQKITSLIATPWLKASTKLILNGWSAKGFKRNTKFRSTLSLLDLLRAMERKGPANVIHFMISVKKQNMTFGLWIKTINKDFVILKWKLDDHETRQYLWQNTELGERTPALLMRPRKVGLNIVSIYMTRTALTIECAWQHDTIKAP